MPDVKQARKIEDITAELRLGFADSKASEYFTKVADEIEAAYNEGILRAIDELMQGKIDIGKRQLTNGQ